MRMQSWMVLLVLVSLGCGSESTEMLQCSADELYDQLNNTCVPRGRVDNNPPDTTTDAGADDGVEQDMDLPDMEEPNNQNNITNNNNNTIPPECDRDNDRSLNAMCGGRDCDDDDPYRSPLHFELCDTIDNDCDDEVNEGIECSFFAHSGTTLYKVDPFLKTLETIGEDLPNLQDIDTHPDGTLYGVTFDGLFKFNETTSAWTQVGDFVIDVEDPNGMAIDFDGTIFVTGQNKVYTVDATTGRATVLGLVGGDFYSSGDCVVNKYDTLFMTSKHDPDEDTLVQIDRATGVGTQIGPIGYQRVFGLIAAWGKLWGLTRTGDLITINESTGASELVHSFEGVSFFGAASTPDR